jgi:uncharacterized MAPEG superfamily protein
VHWNIFVLPGGATCGNVAAGKTIRQRVRGPAGRMRAGHGGKCAVKPELIMLVWCVALAFAQMLVAVLGAMRQVGLPLLASNREAMPTLTDWAGRAARAHRNMLESLVLFAVLVLVAQAAGISNGATMLGAQLFFWARLVYAVIYVVGLPWVRTLVWAVSVVGLLLIFSQVV